MVTGSEPCCRLETWAIFPCRRRGPSTETFLRSYLSAIALAIVILGVFPFPESLSFFPSGSAVFACGPEPGAHHYPEPPAVPQRPAGYWIAYREINGFPEDDVTSVHGINGSPCDQTSLIAAAGTRNNGLAIFRGSDFTCHTVESSDGNLPSNSVHDVLVINGKSGTRVYAATSSGIAVYDVGSDMFKEPVGSDETGLNVLALGMSKGSVVYATDRAIVGLDGTLYADLSPGVDSPVTALPLCIASTGDEVFSGFEDTLWKVESGLRDTELPRDENAVYVKAVHVAPAMLAAATVKGIMVRGPDGEWQVIDSRSGLPGDWVTALWIDETLDMRSLPFSLFDPFTGSPVKYLSGPARDAGEGAEVSKKLAEYERLRTELMELRDAAITAALNGYNTPEFQRFSQKYNEIWSHFDEARQAMAKSKKADGSMGFWAGTGGQGLAILNDGAFSVLRKGDSPLTSDEINDIWYDPAGRVGLVATRGGGLLRYQTNAITANPDPVLIYPGKVNRLRMSGGKVYCCTERDGLMTVDPPRMSVDRFPFPEDSGIRVPNSLWDVGFSSDNRMLMAAGTHGLYSWDGNEVLKISGTSSEGATGVVTIHCSESGATWLGCDNGNMISDGISRLSPDGILLYSKDFLSKFVGMTRDQLKEAIKGVSRIAHAAELLVTQPNPSDPGKERFTMDPNYDNTAAGCGQVTEILEIEHLVLFGTRSGGMTCLKGGRFTTVTPNRILKGSSIQGMGVDHKGSILVASGKQAAIFNGREWKTFLLPPEFLGSDVNAFLADPDSPGTVWLGLTLPNGTGAAVCVHDDGTAEAVTLKTGGVYQIALAGNMVYMTSGTGLYAVKLR